MINKSTQGKIEKAHHHSLKSIARTWKAIALNYSNDNNKKISKKNQEINKPYMQSINHRRDWIYGTVEGKHLCKRLFETPLFSRKHAP